MDTLKLFKLAGIVSRPLFRYLPAVYFRLYSFYKYRTDASKLRIIRHTVQKGDWVVDVGAHIGFYTKELAKLVGPQGRVFAYEPNPENYEFLKKNVRAQENTVLRNTAVGDRTGQTRLYLSFQLNVDHRTYATSTESRRFLTVPQVTLDSELLQSDKKIAFIKMDIQGFEYFACRGMRQLLNKDLPVVLAEFWPWGLRQSGSSARQLLEFFKGQKYQIKVIQERGGSYCVPLESFNFRDTEKDYYDILCLPPSKL